MYVYCVCDPVFESLDYPQIWKNSARKLHDLSAQRSYLNRGGLVHYSVLIVVL